MRPSVATVLAAPTAYPGRYVNGWVNLRCGVEEVVVDRVVICLVVDSAADEERNHTELGYRPWSGELQRSVVGQDPVPIQPLPSQSRVLDAFRLSTASTRCSSSNRHCGATNASKRWSCRSSSPHTNWW